jgi:hypothetical protein
LNDLCDKDSFYKQILEYTKAPGNGSFLFEPGFRGLEGDEGIADLEIWEFGFLAKKATRVGGYRKRAGLILVSSPNNSSLFLAVNVFGNLNQCQELLLGQAGGICRLSGDVKNIIPGSIFCMTGVLQQHTKE